VTGALVFLVLGLGLLVGGAELLVRGAARLASALGVSALVIGLTVVAYGTSAPELAVSAAAALRDRGDLALGNVVGSNIFNVLVILGISSIITPLAVAQQLVRVDVPLMIGASGLAWLLARDGRVGHGDGALLLALALAYTVFAIRISRREKPEIRAEYEGSLTAGGHPGRRGWLVDASMVLAGLAVLVVGSRWLVEAAVTLARAFGLSELVIGLTIVAAGTSLPEAATSIVAARRGERDIAVGNIVGSNLFNLLAVLGLSALVGPMGVSVSAQAQAVDLPVMMVVALACLPVVATGHRIERWEGSLLLLSYGLYLGYLLALALGHPATARLGLALGWVAVPLLLLAVSLPVASAVAARLVGSSRPGARR